jgi:hypothetical protein
MDSIKNTVNQATEKVRMLWDLAMLLSFTANIYQGPGGSLWHQQGG